MSNNEAPAIKSPPRLWPLLILGAALFAGVFYLRHLQTAPPPAAPATTSPQVAAAPPHAPTVPADADAQVLQAVSGLSSTPLWATWLKAGDLARRFVATTNAIADGLSPHNTLAFLAPSQQFRVERRHDHIYIAPKSFERYDSLADVVGSIDASGAARAYETLHPLLNAAYAEMGKPGTTLDDRVSEAVKRVESVQVPDGSIEVIDSGALYKFADKSLEDQPAANKHLIRMGSRNLKIVQAKLQEIATDLHLSAVASAHPN